MRVPAIALLGPLNGGWQVATTTLSHERAGAARLYAEMQLRLQESRSRPGRRNDRRPARTRGPATLRRLGEIAVRIKYLELLCLRSISATLHGGDAFGSASLAKTVWGEVGSGAWPPWLLTSSARQARRSPWAHHRLSSRSLTIAGGTTQINKNITAQRVLGLPRHEPGADRRAGRTA